MWSKGQEFNRKIKTVTIHIGNQNPDWMKSLRWKEISKSANHKSVVMVVLPCDKRHLDKIAPSPFRTCVPLIVPPGDLKNLVNANILGTVSFTSKFAKALGAYRAKNTRDINCNMCGLLEHKHKDIAIAYCTTSSSSSYFMQHAAAWHAMHRTLSVQQMQ